MVKKKNALMYAIENECDITLISKLINNDTINLQDLDGLTPLMFSIKIENKNENKNEIINLLIKKGSKINLVDYQLRCSLMHAINYECDIKIISQLINNNTINLQDSNGLTFLMYLFDHDNFYGINFILSIIEKVNKENINLKDEYGNTILFYILLIINNNINNNNNNNNKNKIIKNIKLIINKLIEKGININHKNNNDFTFLMIIISNQNNNNLSEYLINKQNGNDFLRDKNKSGDNVLDIITQYSNRYMYKIIVQYYIKHNMKDNLEFYLKNKSYQKTFYSLINN